MYNRLQKKYFFPKPLVLSYQNSPNFGIKNRRLVTNLNHSSNSFYSTHKWRNEGKSNHFSVNYNPQFQGSCNNKQCKILLDNFEKIEKDSNRDPFDFELEKTTKNSTQLFK